MFVDKSVEEVVQSEGVPHVRGREEEEEEVQKGRMKTIDCVIDLCLMQYPQYPQYTIIAVFEINIMIELPKKYNIYWARRGEMRMVEYKTLKGITNHL